MKIFDAKRDKGTKLCQLNAGRLVRVHLEDGTLSPPLILMSNTAYRHVKQLQPEPQQWGGPPPPPMPAMPQAPQQAFDSRDARLLDPITGDVYVVHSSTRATTLDSAALVLNYVEGC